MLQLFNSNKEKISSFKNYKDLCIESVLSTGDSTLSFLYSLNENWNEHLIEEAYIRNKVNEYVIKSRRINNDDIEIICTLNLEDLEGTPFDRYVSEVQSITNALNLALVGTGWTVAINNITKKRTVRKTCCSSYDIIQEIKKIYRVDIVFDTLNKKIYVYEKLGEDKGAYAIEKLNLTSLSVESDSYNYFTRIIPQGKDGLTIESINAGKKYVENYQYTNKVKTYYWKDERYTVVEALKEDAIAKLEELSKPYRSYSGEIKNLAKINKKYSILEFGLGDTMTLISKNKKIRDKQRIVKITEYPGNHTKDTFEIANLSLRFEDQQDRFEEAADIIDNVTTDDGTIDGDAIDEVTTDKIKDFNVEVGKVVNLEAVNAKIENLEVNKATIQSLHAVEAKIGTLEATKANITDLTATNASIENLKATKADITELNAVTAKVSILEVETAKIGVLEGNVANIQDIIGGNISSDNIQTGGITGDRLNMNTIFVTDANIVNINASKINAGEIDTSKIKIKGKDGAIEIAGATQQFRDKNNKVRIQMGQDTQKNFNFILRGEDGTTTLIDHTGIKEKAIADNLIKENMVAENAVGEKAINYNSFSSGFNKDTNTTQLKATKIRLDNQNQTLDLAFTSLKNQSDGTKTQTESNSTSISVQQGQINTAIANTKIVKDGKEILLKDDYNTTVATVDSMKNAISSHTTKIDEHTGKITGVEAKTNVLERDLNSMTSRLTSTESTVKNHTTQITTAQNTANNANSKADKAQSDAINVNDKLLNLKPGAGNLFSLKNIKDYAGGNLSNNKFYTVNGTLITAINQPVSSSLIGNKILIKNAKEISLSGKTDLNIVNVYFRCYNSENIIIQQQASKNFQVIDSRFEGNISIPEGTEYINLGIGSTSVRDYFIDLLSIQLGNKNSGWVPNAIDIEMGVNKNKNDIITVNTEVTTTKNKVSGIEQNINSITQKVGSIETTTISQTTTINSHTNLINAADSKINTAISDGKTYTDLEVNKVVTSTNSKFAEIKTTTDSISSKVSQVENATTTINNKVISQENRIASAEQKITTDAIVNTVVNSKKYQDDKGNVYTKSQADSKIEQTADSIKQAVTTTSSSNLIENSGAVNNDKSIWYVQGNNNNLHTWGTTNQIPSQYYFETVSLTSNTNAYSNRFAIIGGQTYTLTGYIFQERYTVQPEIYVLASDTISAESGRIRNISYDTSYRVYYTSNEENWVKFKLEFKAKASNKSAYVRVDNIADGQYQKKMKFSSFMLTRGMEQPWDNTIGYTQARTEMNLLNEEIQLKVEKNGVIAAINLSTEEAKIDAKSIKLNGATTVDNGDGKKVTIEEANYTAFYNDIRKASFGFGYGKTGEIIPMSLLGYYGINNKMNDYKKPYFVEAHYPPNENPASKKVGYYSQAYKCVDPALQNSNGAFSGVNFTDDGEININPLNYLNIYSNKKRGQYTGLVPNLIATFGSSSHWGYDAYLEIDAMINMRNGWGLVLGDEMFGYSNLGVHVRIDADIEDGTRYMRPMEDNIQLGSADHPWYKWHGKALLSSDGIVSYKKTKVIGDNLIDSIEIVNNFNKSNQEILLDVSRISGTKLAPVNKGIQEVDFIELAKHLLIEIKVLKNENLKLNESIKEMRNLL